MYKFTCKTTDEDGRPISWTGTWEVIDVSQTYCEMRITGRGSAYNVILGKCRMGYFLCIPEVEVGCPLAEWSDLFWNTSQISRFLGETDAITIATALYTYEEPM